MTRRPLPLLLVVATVVAPWFLSPRPAAADPGWGLWVSKSGDIYFTDLMHHRGCVWKLSADGKRTRVIRNKHTHSIYLDPRENLYGTNNIYLEGKDYNENELWKIDPSGGKSIVIPSTDGTHQFTGGAFAVDREGNVYYPDSERPRQLDQYLVKRQPDGSQSILAGGARGHKDGKGEAARFRHIGTMTSGPDGALYVSDADRIRKVTLDGTVTTVARGLLARKRDDPPHKNFGDTGLYGIAVHKDGTVYVAYHGNRRVLKVSPQGEAREIYHAKSPWSPTGVALSGDDLYILESGFVEGKGHIGPRVRKMTAEGKVTTLVVVPDEG